MESMIIDEKIEALLEEFSEHRTEIKKMIAELDEIRNTVSSLLPTTMDKRYVRYFEEKVKAMSNLFGTLLEMRKEISKSLKDEIEIRRKLKKEDEDLDIEDQLDMRSIAEKLEKYKEDKKKMIEKFEQDESVPEGVEIPGLNVDISS